MSENAASPVASSVAYFGVRHHGPGSARSLALALEKLAPDLVLIEGPPEADALIPLAAREDMKPPVALMLHVPDRPSLCSFYPFAEFSPEWQAMTYAVRKGVPVFFMDLGQTQQLALRAEAADKRSAEAETGGGPRRGPEAVEAADGEDEEPAEAEARDAGPAPEAWVDPLDELGRTAGYADGEEWWEHVVEQRMDGADQFAAIREAMALLREGPRPSPEDRALQEARREAHMRRAVRKARAEGFERIAVVCGAWHVPALESQVPAREDDRILKDLPRIKVQATWIPWTYGRLAYANGYGAGIGSPGWYHHLWQRGGRPGEKDARADVINHWLVKAARLLREQDFDVSTAHLIETRRLAETLAAMRGKALAGLDEINEAILAVMLSGDPTALRLIEKRLMVGDRLGKVPPDAPAVPIQVDLEKQQKTVRLKPAAGARPLDLDLRKPADLARSRLLHRLRILSIPWGEPARAAANGKGTFHELWTLEWKPELALAVVEAAVWGNTVLSAASARAAKAAAESVRLGELAALIDKALLADLPEAVPALAARLEGLAARSHDVAELMEAVPPLAETLRYGNVRGSDVSMLEPLIRGMAVRVAIGLPMACSSLDDEAAAKVLEQVARYHAALQMIQAQDLRESWLAALRRLADQDRTHGLVAGHACRLLLDAGYLPPEQAARRLGLALSPANDPLAAAAWLEGFLRGSGMVLVHDRRLWDLLDAWVAALPEDRFASILPLARRAFSLFSGPERKLLGERARKGGGPPAAAAAPAHDIDWGRAEAALPMVRKLLGLPEGGPR